MNKNLPYLIFIIFLTLIICGPNFFDDRILNLLDYVFVPHQTIDLTLPLGQISLHVFSFVFGPALGSKFFFILILFLGGLLGLAFATAIGKRLSFSGNSHKILGILFFTLNPFAYERMITQPTIYLGTLLIGWGIYFLLLKDRLETTESLLAGMSMGLACACFPHAAYMIALIYILYLTFFARTWQVFLQLFLSGALALLLNLNWLLAPLFGTPDTLTIISEFDTANLDAFASRAIAPLGIALTNLLLYGFWGEISHIVPPTYMSPYWYLWGMIILGMSIFGAYTYFKNRNEQKRAYFFIILAGISLVLGLGISTGWSRLVIELAYEYLPYFRGYREPQKWIGLLMIAEGIFFLIATIRISAYFHDTLYKKILTTFLVITLVLWSPGMIWGFRGQLTTMDYPKSLEVLRTEILETAPDAKLLVFPWHSYMACSWTNGRVIANSLHTFLTPLRVTIADNIEMRGKLYSNSKSTESQTIESFLRSQGENHQAFLALGYSHILVMKVCASMDTFAWLGEIKECQNIRDDSEYALYRCN